MEICPRSTDNIVEIGKLFKHYHVTRCTIVFGEDAGVLAAADARRFGRVLFKGSEEDADDA